MAYKGYAEPMQKQTIPRMVTIREAAGTGILTESCIRQMIREGTLPTKVIKHGKRFLLNLDLLIENLGKEN